MSSSKHSSSYDNFPENVMLSSPFLDCQTCPKFANLKLYLHLRQDSHILTGNKPILADGLGLGCKPALTDLKNTFMVAENSIRAILEKTSNNNNNSNNKEKDDGLAKGLHEVFYEMELKLRRAGEEIVAGVEGSLNATEVEKQIVKNFWLNVRNFTKVLRDWMEEEILPVLSADEKEWGRESKIQEILESGLEVILGMYC